MSKKTLLVFVIILLYTRFVGLAWGLPHTLHPDEMNMVVAMMGLKCQSILDIANCMNPHFFAYGQPPLYLGYISVFFIKFFDGSIGASMSYNEATIALRFIAATSSLMTIWFAWKIVRTIQSAKQIGSGAWINLIFWVILIFSPGLIQFAHFGTTESILMACYTAITYYLLNPKTKHWIVKIGLIAGVAVATKMSATLFLPIIFICQIYNNRNVRILKSLLMMFVIVALTAIILSPHSLINWSDFVSSMGYESAVGTGNVKVFYTTQFENTLPIVFQFMHIFPYSLGFWQVFAFIIGFVLLPYNRYFNVLRLMFLLFFIPSAFLYAKWTRFIAPALPLMLIFSVFCTSLIYSWIKQKFNSSIAMIYLILVLGFVVFQGAQFLSIYIRPDIRFEASEWINRNLPRGSFILSEERNVANTPIDNNSDFRIVNFDFYDLADNQYLQYGLDDLIKKADYIIVPSRRVFANYANDNYPLINNYYQNLNNGKLGFKLIKEFKPTIIDDENAEETFSVFDHPVIRIYKRI